MRVAVVLLIAGCLEPSLLVCDDGTACPIDRVCDVAHHTCVDPEQLAVCVDAADYTRCEIDEFVGECIDHVCVGAGCGNSIVDPDEACDDGNAIDGDGCSRDCASNETCGNGVLDAIRAEACDDGNAVEHDGCDVQCRDETVLWQIHPITPETTEWNLYAFDENRGRLVLISDGITWEWDGAVWSTPALAPQNAQAGLVYDPDRRRVAAIGESGYYEWDGVAWSPHATIESLGTALYATYDTDLHRIVSFVGNYVDIFDAATTTWVTESQLLFFAETVVYDRARHRLVVLGRDRFTQARATWELDGATFTKIDATPGAARVAYDTVRGRAIAVGDDGIVSAWDGAAWTPLAPTLPPHALWSAWFDPIRDVIGTFGSEAVFEIDSTDAYDRTPPHPGPVDGIAYDALREHLVLDSNTGETWTWTESGGFVSSPSTMRPSPRVSMAFDPVRGAVVAYDNQSTWTFTTEWMPTPFDGNYDYATGTTTWMTYDPDGQRMMFTGLLGLWSLPSTATAWMQIAPGPPSVDGGTLEYDPTNRRYVFLGATGSLYDLVDDMTWQPTLSPGVGYRLVRSVPDHSIMLVPASAVLPVWERIGVDWKQRRPPPIAVEGPAIAMGDRVIVVGHIGASRIMLSRRSETVAP